MRSPAPDRVQWALIVQRLMDADLLLPEDGQKLLAALDDALAVSGAKSTPPRRGPRAARPGTERNRER